MMRSYVLASGSEGNSTYVEFNNHKILIDLGTNVSYITSKLKEIGVKPSSIEYVLITHTHTDHIAAIENFIKKYKPTICLTKSMLESLNIDNYENLFLYEDGISDIDLDIYVIKTSHDISDSRGFIINSGEEKLVYITDTGYLNTRYFEKLRNCEYYVLESNHDTELLINGRYPKWLQKRILSDKGHLSNSSTAFYLTKLIGPKTKKVVLAHLSKENNKEEVALATVKSMMKEYNIKFDNFCCAKQDQVVGVTND